MRKENRSLSVFKEFGYNEIVWLFLIYSIVWLVKVLGIFPMKPLIQFTLEVGLSMTFIVYGWHHDQLYREGSLASRILIVFGAYNLFMWVLSIILLENAPNLPIVVSNLPGFLLIFSVFSFGNKELLPPFVRIAKHVWIPIFICVIGYYFFNQVPYNSSKSNYFFLFVFIVYPFIKKSTRFLFDAGILLYCYIYEESRSMIMIFIIYLILFLTIYRVRVSNSLLRVISKTMLVSTIVFFTLAALGIFNILSDFSDSTDTTDSRSGLYTEINDHLAYHKAYIFGTPGKGYKSSFNELPEGKTPDGEYIDFSLWWHGRMSVESGILTLALQGGLVNVLLISLLFFSAINYVCRHAKNRYCLYIAVLLAFRYPFMFVDGLITFYNQAVVMWIMFAICLSKQYLSMKDSEIQAYFKHIIS